MTNEELQPQPFILVQGHRVGLGALRQDLIPTYLKWRSDLEVLRGTGESTQVPTVEAMQAWYEQATSPGNRDVHFTMRPGRAAAARRRRRGRRPAPPGPGRSGEC